MTKISTSFLMLGLLAVSACVPGEAFETDPVRVPTTKGDVYCQLYTRDIVMWDHSISHTNNMSTEEADDICYEMGKRMADEAK